MKFPKVYFGSFVFGLFGLWLNWRTYEELTWAQHFLNGASFWIMGAAIFVPFVSWVVTRKSKTELTKPIKNIMNYFIFKPISKLLKWMRK